MAPDTPTTEEVNSLAAQVQTFLPEAEDGRPSTFLSLAPATSPSYPQPRKSQRADSAGEATKRRSSSGSAGGLRILKLGPVHWGEHLDDHQEDWHEVIVE